MNTDPIQQFRAAIQSAGLIPPERIEADGKLHRFASNGKRSDDAGWYVLHVDGIPAGSFGDWRTDHSQTWVADLGRELSEAEKAAQRAKLETMRRHRESEESKRREEAAVKAVAIWKAAKSVTADHPYLTRKSISPVEALREIGADKAAAILGYSPKSRGEALHGRLLVIPVKVGKSLSTLELIDSDGRKSALYGGAKRGGYWAAQPLPGGNGAGLRLLIGEGMATVLSAKEASGHPAIAALSCGNLPTIAKAMRERYPAAEIVILADLGNGHSDAETAARSVGGRLALPDFGDDRPDGASDFNDMAKLCGVEAVKRTISSAIALASENARTVNLIRGSDIKPEAVSWLWPGWLALGKMHVLGGAPGTGKTTISMALAATVTTGGRWPDGSRTQAGNVVIWSGEDDPADTLIPRLALSGADLSRVFFVSEVREGNERRSFDPARDMEVLRHKLAEIGQVRLLIVDPIVSAVAGDSHKNAEVRRSLQPLADLAASMRCALLGITHFSKGTGGRDPVERLTGSLAFGALARVVMVAAKHQADGEDGRTVRLFLRAKSNIGPDDGGFEYDLHQGELKEHPGIFASAVLWGEPVEGAARELLATADTTTDQADQTERGEAMEWLRALLSNGPMASKEVKQCASRDGLAWATVRRAQKALGIKPGKTRFDGGWEWSLPPKVLIDFEDAQQKELGTFGDLEQLGDISEANAHRVEVEV